MYFEVRIAFSNEGEVYGEETHWVECDLPKTAEQIARRLAGESRYDDDRIPDRSYEIELDEVEAEDVPVEAVVVSPSGPKP